MYRKTTYGRNKLSKLWDREAIGTPEAHQLLTSLKFPWHASEVRIFDVGFADDEYRKFLSSEQIRKSLRLTDKYTLNADEFEHEVEETLSAAEIRFLKKLNPPEHGVLVAHLLAGKSPLPGISARGEISLLSDVNPLTNDASRQYLELPGVVNLSKKTYTRDVDKLDPVGEKTLFVTAAGNYFPEKSDNVILASRALEQDGKAKIIPVGATNPDGTVSEYSVADRSIVVTAPGERLFSFDGKKEKRFSHTSAAAPYVSGALADVRSILPQLTQNNAVQLLESTAIKTVTNEVSELNGAGVVNHYKMVRVALRLAEEGYDGELMPDNLDAYLDFNAEVANLIDSSKNATEFFLNLRRAFFLDPNNDAIRLQLAGAYRQMELMSQANFYDLTLEAVKSKPVEAKLNQRAYLIKKRLKGHFSSSPPIDRRTIPKIVDNMDNTSPKKYLLHLAEDDNAFKQLLKTINTEEKMVAEIIANERFPNIHTNAEINEQLAEAGLPAVRANVQLYLEKLGLSETDKRRSIAERAILSDFFKSNTPDKNLTDEEVAKLTGISTDNIQAYKHSWLKKFAKKITQDSGYNSHTAQQIQNQLLTQEGIFIPQQTITNYLHNNNLESAFKEVIADEEPHNPYYDPEIAARVSSKTGIEVTARYVAKLRKQLAIANATERKRSREIKECCNICSY